MIKKFIERMYPLVLSFILCLFLKIIGINGMIISRFDVFISSLITVSVTVVGFIITIIAVIIGLLDREIMKTINEKKAMNLLREYFITPVMLGFLTIIDSFILTNTIDKTGLIANKMFYISIIIVVSFALSLIRITYILSYLFKNVSEEYIEIDIPEEVEKISEDKIFNDKL